MNLITWTHGSSRSTSGRTTNAQAWQREWKSVMVNSPAEKTTKSLLSSAVLEADARDVVYAPPVFSSLPTGTHVREVTKEHPRGW